MSILKQSTARNRMVFMVDSTDHVSGKAGLTLTITASKDGAAFSGISPTVTDRSNGWYELALTTAHTDTLGDFALHITSTGADPTDLVDQVCLDLPGSGGSGATAAEVWDYLTASIVTANSIGKLLKDNVDATISTRLPTVSYTTPPTAIENADALLTRDWTSVGGAAARSALNALRFLRNKWTITATTLTVMEEDDATPAWTGAVTTSPSDPVDSIDPT